MPGLQHALYAVDVTLWTNSESAGEQETALRAYLGDTYDYIRACGTQRRSFLSENLLDVTSR